MILFITHTLLSKHLFYINAYTSNKKITTEALVKGFAVVISIYLYFYLYFQCMINYLKCRDVNVRKQISV